ncbi:sporulation integral membrane protein YlbJ [Cytobacillus purgationiresistens]|uniref:Sporulation integral membrane protein YlbJ n=1 Tax=Cytobacillus purgationiresistens TaxID=863449 RepID=A0ABU0APS6_9BACI|nr:sporulation integral membrane protein YlbJ [Cytobacillus purgationiresistens]MDQ0272388.1 sporulation integral membrane protein YlbJ [Cytobacillus purgationiresistens]
MLRSKIKTIILALSVSLVALSLISFPQESIDASTRGLNMWWEIVFPSLLPFFIVSEILIGFGVVRFIGVLLEPLMRPLFKVPGVGGFVLAMGMASGYPAGAKFTARLRQEKQISRIEAERLVSFSNCSNPLFIFGAVSVGFFNNAKIGIILALAHYLGNITVGLLMRFYGKNQEKEEIVTKKRKATLRSAFSVLHQTRMSEQRPLGKLLGDAVMSSIQTLLMIGGFIILFSVINKLLFHVGITVVLAKFLEVLLSIFQLSPELSIALFSGIFELTLGNQMASQVDTVTLMEKVIVASAILAFCGFSVQAQVASILAQTDIRFKPFFFARIIHAFIAALYAFIFWKVLYERLYQFEQPSNAIPVFLFGEGSLYYQLVEYGPIITIASLMIYIFILAKRIYLPNGH